MAKMHVNPNRATDKTVRAIDRKREQERKKMFIHARDHAEILAIKLVQRLMDKKIIETTSVDSMHTAFEKQLKSLAMMDEFDLQLKLAPVRTLSAGSQYRFSLVLPSTLWKTLSITMTYRISTGKTLIFTGLLIQLPKFSDRKVTHPDIIPSLVYADAGGKHL